MADDTETPPPAPPARPARRTTRATGTKSAKSSTKSTATKPAAATGTRRTAKSDTAEKKPATAKRKAASAKPRAAKRPAPAPKRGGKGKVETATEKVGGKWGAAAIVGGIAAVGAATAALLSLRGSTPQPGGKDGSAPDTPIDSDVASVPVKG